jgi:lipopolysaccharide transport protein LptA
MGNTRIPLHHILRFISIGILCVVLFAISFNFLTRSKRQVKVPEIAMELEEQKINKKEKVEFREMDKDKIDSEVTADKHYIGEDNLYHLEGNVKISLFGRGKGEDILLSGEEIVHDSEWSYFWLQGNATVEFKDLVVKSSVLEYDAQKGVFKSDQTVRFFSDSISGSAQKCDYNLGQKKAELRGSVYIELQARQESSVPVEIDTEYFEYFVGKGRGKAEGRVELAHGKSRATAGFLEFVLSASREQIKSLYLKEKVNISLVDEFRKVESFSEQTALAMHGDKCLIEASEILIKGYVDSPQVRKLEATGECVFRFVSETGSFTQIEGHEIAFDMTKKGGLKKLVVDRNAKIFEEDKEKESARSMEGGRIQILGDKKIVIIEGEQTSLPRIWSKETEITAQKISLFLDNNNLEASGDTKVIVYPKEKSQETAGFFSEENPVFITAAEMRYSEEHKRFRFSGGTKLWQMKETIKAEEMFVSVETGAFRARGNVQSILSYLPEGKEEEENARIESSAMEYDPEKNVVLYREKVRLIVRDAALTASRLTIDLDKESGDMANIVALGRVVVVQKTYEGHGEEARFDVPKEIITIVGNPVLIDKNRGRTEGGKLTFYMADGRIVIENKDRERSITIIKS